MIGRGSVAFRVEGDPVTQGSMKRFPNGGITHSNKKLVPWRQLVAWTAKEVWGPEFVTGPVVLHCMFTIGRPKGHYGQGANAMVLKPSAPDRHVQKPDVDKLLRAICDALTGIVYRDDSQIDGIHATKRWSSLDNPPGVIIIIETEPTEGSDQCQQE
jgi:crossover junction endodeoxyribonuclease RusA